jgi:hypothetical protein
VTVPSGSLPVYSVDTEEEAQSLLVLACGTNNEGQFIARELVVEQTLDNLDAFGARLEETDEMLKKLKAKHGKQIRHQILNLFIILRWYIGNG